MKEKLIKAAVAVAMWVACFATVMWIGGCAVKQNSIEFNPTNSMCLDATVANIHAAGCYAVSVEKTIYGMTEVYCHDTTGSNEDSKWVSSKFVGIAFGTRIPEQVQPICTDPFMIMTVEENDNE
tara:strand:+ start:1061 stop:1432 length:372 start_codon:yes stop_codon:yes gene_type:complete